MEILDRGHVFRIALLPKFGQEVVLLQRSAAPQKFEQRIFQILGGLFRLLIGGFKLGKIGDQSPWRNTELRRGRGTLAQNVDQVAHLGALLRRAGRKFHSHAVAGMNDSNHAFGMNLKLVRF